MQNSVFKQNLTDAVHQACLIILFSVIMGITVNLIRPDSIPFVKDWSVEGRLSLADGDSLEISLSDAKALFKENKAVFLDARESDLFDEGHIKGARNLPWHGVDDYFSEITKGMDLETPVITYCDGESCELSHDLALFLKNMGFTHVKVLVNGWTIWQENQLPVQSNL